MKIITTLGIDLAKNVFQLHGVDQHGQVVLRKKMRRANLLPFLANIPTCLIGIEACCGAHYWGREFEALGHTVRQINPAFVKPFRKAGKNDMLDAEAICEAVTRPNMRFVACKSQEQLDIQAMHRVRERLVHNRTALGNQIRGFLAEHGIVFPKELSTLRQHLPALISDPESGLTPLAREMTGELYEELQGLDKRIAVKDAQLKRIVRSSEPCQRLMSIPGVGVATATALVAAVADAKQFSSGRQMAAWIGLVPRQHSTGGKTRLLGITKRGDSYLRSLLIHGARSVLRHARQWDTRLGQWLRALELRRGACRAIVALANKLARICWAVLVRGQPCRMAQIPRAGAMIEAAG